MDLPRFNGDDVVGWLAMAERYLRAQRVPPHECVSTIATHFGPDASVWMNAFEQRHPTTTWDHFVTALLEHFGSGSNADFKASLSHLQHVNSVEEYISAFTKLSCRAPDWSDDQLLPIFCGGLKSEIRHDVMALEPESLAQAQRLARRYEAKLADIRANRTSRTNSWSYSTRPTAGPNSSPNPLPAHPGSPLSFSSSQPTVASPLTRPQQRGPFKHVSPFEQRERRAKGLCFHCDEQYTSTHVCKKPIMAILDCISEDATEIPEPTSPPEETDAEQSHQTNPLPLHAITKTKLGEMMRFLGSIQNLPLNIFVDCGSAMNFLHPSIASQLALPISPAPPIQFKTASGQTLSPSGLCTNVTVTIQDYQFTSSFLLLPVAGCDLLLGAEWLDSLGFIGWHFAEKIMVFTTQEKCHVLQGITSHPQPLDQHEILAILPSEHLDPLGHFLPTPSISTTEAHDPTITSLLNNYQTLFLPPTGLPPSRSIDHRIPLVPNTSPVSVRPYRYAHSQKEELDTQVTDMLTQGIIRPSRSPYSSPVLLVRKKEGTWRFCVDYRALNAVTIKDRFPIPVVDELLDELHGSTYFSKLDLRSGYHQIRMHEEDISKTAFRTHDGHYEFVVMPFGLSNAPSTFQALMNHVFKHLLRKYVLVFFDDILVYSKDLSSHLTHLEKVFQILQDNHLKVKLSKCSFGQPSVNYLGHVISGTGVSVDASKVQCLTDWPKPTTLKALRGFLGLAGYYRRFVKNFGLIARPLTDMLKANNFIWTPLSEEAFQQLKLAVTTAPVLALPDFSKSFTIETDASGLGMGAVLTQDKHPIAFLSKAFSPKNQALSVYDKEMRAILYAVDKWRPYVLGRPFTIITDHQTLKHLLDQRITTPSQHKCLAKLLGYDYKIEYRAGHLNTVPDVLSRRPELCSILAISAPIFDSIHHIEQACLRDAEAVTITEALRHSQPTPKGFSLVNNRLMYKSKIFVPKTSDWRAKLLHEFHSSLQAGHSGYLRTYVRLSRSFAWPGMRKAIKEFVASCDQCQRQSYETIHPPGLLQPLSVPEQVWFDVSMDFIDGLPASQGFNAILVVVDRLSKFGHSLPFLILTQQPRSLKHLSGRFFDYMACLNQSSVTETQCFLANFGSPSFDSKVPNYAAAQLTILRATVKLRLSIVALNTISGAS